MTFLTARAISAIENNLTSILRQFADYLGMGGALMVGPLSLTAKKKGCIHLIYSFEVGDDCAHVFSFDLKDEDGSKVIKAFLISDQYRAYQLEMYNLYIGK